MSLRITPLDIERFTCGDCGILARAISRITGWGIQSFILPEGQSDMWAKPGDPMGHAFVIMPNGRVLDIEGSHARRTFARHWGYSPHEIGPTTWEDICRAWQSDPIYGEYSISRARTLAPYLLKRYS